MAPLKTHVKIFLSMILAVNSRLLFQELERLINTDFSGSKRGGRGGGGEGGSLLTVQIRSLLSRLDVLLEAMNDLKRQDRANAGGGGGDEKVRLSH